MLKDLENEINKIADEKHAIALKRFFKTGKGQYGEGDIFIGLRNPQCRTLAKKYKTLSMVQTEILIANKVHEKRFIGLLILIQNYKNAKKSKDGNLIEDIIQTYIKHAKQNRINNWDLVDLSAPNLLGDYLINRDKTLLYDFAKTENLWLQRISIIATYAFIRKNLFIDTLNISKILINHKHDLIHKAVGWMLREIGKRDINALELFLAEHYNNMPRTMLRYAIEKFNENKRQQYLKGLV
ncbi:MAG: DNA alkylation repair protein [Bacteroidia bacterium]